MNQYVVGNIVELTGLFKDEDGNPIDPTQVTVEIIEPDGTVVAGAGIQHVASGTYVLTFTPTKIGLHEYRFAGVSAGLPLSAGENNFNATTDFPT